MSIFLAEGKVNYSYFIYTVQYESSNRKTIKGKRHFD